VAPTVTFSGGGGSGAAATVALDEWGQCYKFTITSGGTGYTSAPTVGFTGGDGTGATASAAISKVVASVTVTAGGTGYATAPAVILVPVDYTTLTTATSYDTEIVEDNDILAQAPIVGVARYRDSAGTQTVAGTGTTPTIIKFTTGIMDPDGLYSTSTGAVTTKYAGAAKVRAKVGLVGLAADDVVEIGVYENGAARDIERVKARGISTAIGGGAGGETFRISGSYQFGKGTAVDVRVLTSHGSTVTLSTNSADNTFLFEGIR
jgi:hypothetical protein